MATLTSTGKKAAPVAAVIVALVVTFLGGALVTLLATDRGYPPFESDRADFATNAIALSGALLFGAQVVHVLRAVRQRDAVRPVWVVGLPFAVLALAWVLGWAFSIPNPPAVASADAAARIAHAIHAPAFAIASCIACVPVAALPIRVFQETPASARAFDARPLTTLVFGALSWLAMTGMAINWGADEVVGFTFVPATISLFALTLLSVPSAKNAKHDARWVAVLALLATMFASLACWSMQSSHIAARALLTSEDAYAALRATQGSAWGLAFLVPTAATMLIALGPEARSRQVAPIFLGLAGALWIATVGSSFRALAHVPNLPPALDNDAAVVSVSILIAALLLLASAMPRLVADRDEPRLALPAAACLLLLLCALLVERIGGIPHVGTYSDFGGRAARHAIAELRLSGLWWTHHLGIVLLVLVTCVFALRASLRVAGRGRAGARGIAAFAGGWVLLVVVAAFAFATTTKTSGAWGHILLVLGPSLLAIPLLYLAGRALDGPAPDPVAERLVVRDILLILLLTTIAMELARQAADTRFALGWEPAPLASEADSSILYKDEPGLTTFFSSSPLTPWLLLLPALWSFGWLVLAKRTYRMAIAHPRTIAPLFLVALVALATCAFTSTVERDAEAMFRETYDPSQPSKRLLP